MKKIILGFLSVLCAGGAFAASSTADLSSGPMKKEKMKVESDRARAPGRRVKSDADLYYVGPARRSSNADVYADFAGCDDEGCEKQARSQRAEVKKSADTRKYNLNNPFYQPLAGSFASVTDLSYVGNRFDFKTSQLGNPAWINRTGKYDATQISAMENLSFGITDDISLVGAVRFSNTAIKIKWDQPTTGLQEDKQSESKVDLFAVGAQWRFLNNADWIASLQAAYESLVDAASIFAGEIKVGFKNDDTTIYGFARAQSYSYESDNYGVGVKNELGQTIFFQLQEGSKSALYYEAGIGVFAALNADWSVDASAAYSDAGWHNQIAATAIVSYQPWKNAAIGFYGRLALWDNAADKITAAPLWEFSHDVLTPQTSAAFDNYSEYSAGLRLTLAF